MPVILDTVDHPARLGETLATGEELQRLLRPFPAEQMEAHSIERGIRNVRTMTRRRSSG